MENNTRIKEEILSKFKSDGSNSATDEKIYEITMHGRGGQGAITAALLLCEIAYEDGYKDVLSIPKIGGERHGSPIKAFTKLSRIREVKNYSATEDADITIIFDASLLPIPG
ncbi:MAG: 2-oxoacid:acceptor oxidoreductase family protein, partial [Candidatus Heimdallarchaeota archaeon]|nr:2-oxoacid:acceptor oxidoreductase family protein [Candidatus Heimdallarchaeota archaeon]